MNLLPCNPTGNDVPPPTSDMPESGTPRNLPSAILTPPSSVIPTIPLGIPTPPSSVTPNIPSGIPTPPSSDTPNLPFPHWSVTEIAQPASTAPSKPLSPTASVPSASNVSERRYAGLTTPFELFYGQKPDYRILFKWGSVGYYRRTSDSGIDRGNFDAQSNVGLALGRSNQTNAMIFWDPATSRMNVSADYRLDPTASITSTYPNIVYDGHISPLVLREG
jgi:hypothetical protein